MPASRLRSGGAENADLGRATIFSTLMGGILGKRCRSPRWQVPFAFRTAAEAHAAADGRAGRLPARGDGGQGHPWLPGRRVRQRHAADLLDPSADHGAEGSSKASGSACRPADVHRHLPGAGAEPVTINVNGIYEALKSRKVDAQETRWP